MRELFIKSGGVDIDNIEYLADLKLKQGDEYKSFLAFCDSVYNNRYFEPFIKAIKYAQIKKTFDGADTMEQFNFGRCVSVTLDILYEEFKKRSNEYKSKIK